MILRMWRAQASGKNVEAYERHFREHVLPKLRDIPGHQGASLLRRDTGEFVELMVLTTWESMDTIRQFAGDAADTAVVEPEARAVLDQFDEFVRHYELVVVAER
jgi:heme-degrading monooxygenase HmoA